MGAMAHYITHTSPRHFQPMNANFGIMESLDTPIKNKIERNQAYADRALAALEQRQLQQA